MDAYTGVIPAGFDGGGLIAQVKIGTEEFNCCICLELLHKPCGNRSSHG